MMGIPTMNDLYTQETGMTAFEVGKGEIFVNFNKSMKPFIRVNKYPNESRTFNFTNDGYNKAIKYLMDQEMIDFEEAHLK